MVSKSFHRWGERANKCTRKSTQQPSIETNPTKHKNRQEKRKEDRREGKRLEASNPGILSRSSRCNDNHRSRCIPLSRTDLAQAQVAGKSLVMQLLLLHFGSLIWIGARGLRAERVPLVVLGWCIWCIECCGRGDGGVGWGCARGGLGRRVGGVAEHFGYLTLVRSFGRFWRIALRGELGRFVDNGGIDVNEVWVGLAFIVREKGVRRMTLFRSWDLMLCNGLNVSFYEDIIGSLYRGRCWVITTHIIYSVL